MVTKRNCCCNTNNIFGSSGVMASHSSGFVASWAWRVCLLLLMAILTTSDAACTFPGDLRGAWQRGNDALSLTFTASTVSGLGIQYFGNDVGDFSCHTSSGNQYVISATVTTLSGDISLYICWELVTVTASAFLKYELTASEDIPGIGVARVFRQPTADAFTLSQACSLSSSSEFFTTLVKTGAVPDDVKTQCPSALFADFTYALCADTTLSFCPDRDTGTADYGQCPTQIFNSNTGVVYCMGHVERSGYTYVNLFDTTNSPETTCARLESSGSDVTAVYFSGDCTTTDGANTSLSLTATLTCPLDSGGDSLLPIILGVVIAILALVALGILIHFCLKKHKDSKVADESEVNSKVPPLNDNLTDVVVNPPINSNLIEVTSKPSTDPTDETPE